MKYIIHLILFSAIFSLYSCQEEENFQFPKDFIWGTATSAHQAEGYNYNDWTEWEEMGKILNEERSGSASNHYYQYEEDFTYAEEYLHNAYRFSIEWSRIEPKRDEYDLNEVAHYHQVLDSLKRHHLKPFVTLHHFTNPVWVQSPLHPESDLDGWINPEVGSEFVEFCRFVAEEYGSKVDFWITFNEPLVYVSHGYLSGEWPPGELFHIEHLKKVALNLMFTHAKAYKAIKEADRVDADGDGISSLITIAKSLSYFVPNNPDSPDDKKGAEALDYLFNRWMLNALVYGNLDVDLDGKYDNPNTDPPEGKYEELENTLDILGVNHYSMDRVDASFFKLPPLYGLPDNSAREGEYANDMGWVVYPSSMMAVLKTAAEYKVPIYITENGICDADDDLRPAFIVSFLEQVLKAIQEGIDVRGYFYWSLIDNFEWNSGFYPRFGLIHIDYQDNWKRTPRRSLETYRDIIKARTINKDIQRKYGEIKVN